MRDIEEQLFEKAVVFTDLHFGKRSDSEQHNQDCMQYVTWLCEVVKKEKPDMILFLGDYFDNRSRLRLDTLEYGHGSARQLVQTAHEVGARIFWLVGNHDMFFKQKRTITSLPWVQELSTDDSVVFIDFPMEIGNCFLCPWLVGTEYLVPVDAEVKYVFGHFELPLFLMNEMVECKDGVGLHGDMFHQCEAVYSGHFHKRQTKINPNGIPITYIGNCFPHNFNDVGDRDRGCMVLEWDKEPKFLNFPYGPNYNRVDLSSLVEMIEKGELEQHFNDKSVVECYDDLNIAQEEALEIKEILQGVLRDFVLKPNREAMSVSEETDVKRDGKTVDQIVTEHIRKLDTDGSDYDVEMLLEIYELSDE